MTTPNEVKALGNEGHPRRSAALREESSREHPRVTADRASLPDWPRLMGEDLAARYLSIGTTTLRMTGPQPRRLGRRVLYDRHDLDRWADRLGGQRLTAIERDKESGEVERRFLEKRRVAR